jgi:uncharacterized protein YegJ (DUF2314 family)
MRNLTLALAASAAMLAPAAAQAQVQDRVVNVPTADAGMNAAVARGRSTLADFFMHVGSPAPGETGFLIKYDLLPEPNQAEFIWAEVISHTPGVTIAKLANEPRDTRFKMGQRVTVSDGEIIDWGYYKGGVMQGQFTTRALLSTVSPEEAAAIRKAYGW